MLNSLAGLMGKLQAEQYAKVYYVDNVVGSDTVNNGLSKTKPYAQISKAITVWEAFRLAQTNVNGRGLILVYGTITAYTALTALPNYCDIVGLGADPRGNGSGIPRVTATTGVDTVDDSVGIRGLGVYNMQFTGSGTGYAMDLAICYRSIFENCVFVNKSDGGLRILQGGGITIRNCQFGGDTVNMAYGLIVGNSGGNFNNCLVENNVMNGTTAAIINSAYLCNQSTFRNNTAIGGTNGIVDTSTETNLQGNAYYVNNYTYGSQSASANAGGMKVTNNPTLRCIGNHCSDAGTYHLY
jgi:hypothetical protein